MLKATRELIGYLEQESSPDGILVNCYVSSIISCGQTPDADAALAYVLANKTSVYSSYLFPLIARLGHSAHAEKIVAAFFEKDRLLPGVEPEVLELLGELQYQPIKPVLAFYAFEVDNYYQNKHAVLGLLHFDCAEYKAEIRREIEKTYRKGLFKEFIPALVAKLEDKKEMLEQLYISGSEYCSTDCNAGIVLAFSLSGLEGYPYFKKILFDKTWELFLTSTGTVFYAAKGMAYLNVSFKELLDDLSAITNEEDLRYALVVVFGLLDARINSLSFRQLPTVETYKDIFFHLFSQHDNNLIRKAAQLGMEEEAYALEKQLVLKMEQEILITCAGTGLEI